MKYRDLLRDIALIWYPVILSFLLVHVHEMTLFYVVAIIAFLNCFIPAKILTSIDGNQNLYIEHLKEISDKCCICTIISGFVFNTVILVTVLIKFYIS